VSQTQAISVHGDVGDWLSAANAPPMTAITERD
jgi:hypothetical protein